MGWLQICSCTITFLPLFLRILKFCAEAMPFYRLHVCSVLALKTLFSELGLVSYYYGRVRSCLSAGKVQSLIFSLKEASFEKDHPDGVQTALCLLQKS